MLMTFLRIKSHIVYDCMYRSMEKYVIRHCIQFLKNIFIPKIHKKSLIYFVICTFLGNLCISFKAIGNEQNTHTHTYTHTHTDSHLECCFLT